MSNDDEPRPPHKRERFTLPIDEGLHDKARQKAGSDSTLRAILRGFLRLWINDEYPDIPPDVIEQESRRAQKIRRKKKKSEE